MSCGVVMGGPASRLMDMSEMKAILATIQWDREGHCTCKKCVQCRGRQTIAETKKRRAERDAAFKKKQEEKAVPVIPGPGVLFKQESNVYPPPDAFKLPNLPGHWSNDQNDEVVDQNLIETQDMTDVAIECTIERLDTLVERLLKF